MKNVKLFLTDVDGCLTDGGMYYSAEGDAMKRFCVYDGMGMVLLQQAGIPCGILTSEQSPIVKARAEKLHLDFLYLGVGSKDRAGCLTKLGAAQKICDKLGISLAEVCYVGDDINDIDILSAVGYPCCPPNARPEVLAIPGIHVLKTPGGQGAIREIADNILKERTVFIIQARLGSTRMPAKIIRPFYGGRSIIQLLLEKLKQFTSCDVLLATSTDSSNDLLEQIAKESGVGCFRGSENDVLQRFIDAAESVNAKRIIRVCSDNPFLNEQAIQQLLDKAQHSSADYISFWVNDTPSIKTHFGFWTEYVTLDALKRVRELTSESLYHEHVTNYIYAHPEVFAIEWIPASACLEGRTDIRLTCDTPIDFQNTLEIYAELIGEHPHPTIEDIVAYVDSHPQYLQTMKEEIQKNSK